MTHYFIKIYWSIRAHISLTAILQIVFSTCFSKVLMFYLFCHFPCEGRGPLTESDYGGLDINVSQSQWLLINKMTSLIYRVNPFNSCSVTFGPLESFITVSHSKFVVFWWLNNWVSHTCDNFYVGSHAAVSDIRWKICRLILSVTYHSPFVEAELQ